MAYKPRLHVPHGTYYVVQKGTSLRPIFSSAEDYAVLESVLASRIHRYGVQIHAFCWTPDSIHLALTAGQAPLSRFMQRLTADYSLNINKRSNASVHFFCRRYTAILLNPAAYLVRLIRYIHHVPTRAGLTRSVHDYTLNSHRAYAGAQHVDWLTIAHDVRSADHPSQAYLELMAQAPPDEDIHLFEHGSQIDSRVIGDAQFLAELKLSVSKHRPTISLNQIIDAVARTLGIDRAQIHSRSRKRELSLARALIAWHATECGVASLSTVARELNRQPSTLCIAMDRYRTTQPHLFRTSALYGLVPLGSTRIRVVAPGARTLE